MSKILVIGAGYIGEVILRVFQEANWEAIGASLNGSDRLLKCDVSDKDSVFSLPEADLVIHCAASGRGGEEAYHQVYLQGCINLVERFPKAKLIYTSSSSVYSQQSGEVVTECSETIPERETGKILLAAEQVILQAGGAVARLAGIYGPRRSHLLRKFLDGESIMEEEGKRWINQIHRDDAARAILHLAQLNHFPRGEIFNVVDNMNLSQLELYQALSRIYSKDLPPSGPRDLSRKRGWTHKQVSNAKLRSSGWEPIYPCFLDALDSLQIADPAPKI